MFKIVQQLYANKNKSLLWLVKKGFRYYVIHWRDRRDEFVWFLMNIFAIKSRPVATIHNCRFFLHPKDASISRELAIYRIHEPTATNLLKRDVLKKCRYIVDIGSNIGYYAVLEAKLVGPQGRVLAIEPEAHNYELLKINLTTNNFLNVDVVQCAISDENGKSKLYITEAVNTHSLLRPHRGSAVAVIDVNIRTLDSLVQDFNFSRIDFIRMDIEGGEIKAVKGMYQTLKQYKPCILMELHCDAVGTESIINMLKTLKDLGYNPEYIINRDRDFAWIKNRQRIKLKSMAELFNLIRNYRVATVFLR